MSKIDKIKEKIAYNKFLLGMMIAFALSVGGWIVNNYTDKSLLMVFAIIVEIIVGVLSVVFMKKIDKMIDELEDLYGENDGIYSSWNSFYRIFKYFLYCNDSW